MDIAIPIFDEQIEYDPEPPFDSGSIEKALPAVVEMVRKRL